MDGVIFARGDGCGLVILVALIAFIIVASTFGKNSKKYKSYKDDPLNWGTRTVSTGTGRNAFRHIPVRPKDEQEAEANRFGQFVGSWYMLMVLISLGLAILGIFARKR